MSKNLKRIIRTGFINFWRNPVVSLSAVMVMVIALFVIGSVLFTSALLKYSLNEIKDKVDVNVNILPGVADDEVTKLKASLESLVEVEKVEYVSPQQVYENYREQNKDSEKILAALDELGENPFGAVLNVKAKTTDRYESIQKFLNENYTSSSGATGESIIEKVNYEKKKDIIDKLSALIDAGDKLGLILSIIFIVMSVLITLITIRLAMYMSKDEIQVMTLVGADSGYIRGPFVITGAMYGIVAAIIVLILFYPITFWIGDETAAFFLGMNLFKYYIANFGQFFIVMFVGGILIGSLSSYFAVSRYLRMNLKN